MRLLIRTRVESQSELSKMTRWQGSGEWNDRGFPRGVRGVEVDLTPISMMMIIVQNNITHIDHRTIESILDTWDQNLSSMLSHLRMTFLKLSETPTGSVGLHIPTSLHPRKCCALELISENPVIVPATLVFRVADSQKEGKVSWEDFKVFETRECRWKRGRLPVEVFGRYDSQNDED